jgi:hypothetical protein
MKKIFNFMLVLGGMLVLSASCNKILEEHPKTVYTPGYFSTPAGVEGGLTALYSHLRDVYGDPYTWSDLEAATDECTFSNSGFRGNDFSTGAHVTADNCPKSGFWNFTYINTANGIIENATAAGMSESLIAEARFFRAFYYFDLVRIFGGVPLDLGSGELAFNTSAVRVSVRNTVEEVYKKCIFPDLEFALANIPDKPRIGGALSKTAVRILLSRAYLTYGWWLENPKGLPTYPECTRNTADAKTYFQKAYDLAVEGIENPGPYGLESSFYKVSLGSNDYNKEQVFYSDRTEKSAQYNGAPITGWDQGTNFVCWFHQWNYSAVTCKDNTGAAINPIQRTDSQFLGRPWTRLAPTHEALHTFTDIDKDSRFDGTFTWIFRTNWNQFGMETEWVEGPHGNHIGVKEPFLVFYPYVDESVQYPTSLSGNLVGQGFGAKDGVDSYVIDLRGINRFTYPGLWKQGPYRTNTGSPAGAGEANVGSTRPYIIYKFSELYFIAAEAQVKGATAKAGKSARDLINVIRARAAKWEFKNNEQEKYSADFSAELTAKTPNPVTIDFILDELLREYYGEGKRWFDLARTQQWLERALTYTITETQTTHTPVTSTRDIIELNYMNPIPQGQINAMQMSEEEKKAYQTPGYWLE